MAFKYNSTVKVLFFGDVDACKEHIKFARNQLAILERQMSFQGINSGKRIVSPYNGVTVECISNFSYHEVKIYVAPPEQKVKVIPSIKKEITKKEFDSINLYNIISLAYLWTWDNALIPDPLTKTIEEHATGIGTSKCFNGYVAKNKFILQEEIAIPAITNSETPYRVTDLSQVRYTGSTGKISLIMTNYCLVNDNDIKYISISVLSEGSYPSIIFDIPLGITNYGTETSLLGTTDCIVYVDAALSQDLQKLYKIIVIKGSDVNAKNAVIKYEVYSIDSETNTWVLGNSGSVFAPGEISHEIQLYIRRVIVIGRDGKMGVFSYEDPTPTNVYELNNPAPDASWDGIGDFQQRIKYSTYSVCQKYLFSLDTEEYVETDDIAYIGKVVNIYTYDYDIVKTDDKTEAYDIDRIWRRLGGSNYIKYENRIYTLGSSIEFTNFYTSSVSISSYFEEFFGPSTYGQNLTQSVIDLNQGARNFIFRRTILVCPSNWYTLTDLELALAISELSFWDPECIELRDELGSPRSNYISLVAGVQNGCDYTPLPFEVAGIESFHGYDGASSVNYSMDVDLSYKKFLSIHLIYPIIGSINGALEVKNAFICCDNSIKAAFYGQHVKSSLESQTTSAVQIPLEGSYTVDEKPYSQWHIKFSSATMGSMLVSNVVSAKYGNSLLTNITDSELDPQPENLAPWETDPATYTNLEPFFGIMFYGSKTTKQI